VGIEPSSSWSFPATIIRGKPPLKEGSMRSISVLLRLMITLVMMQGVTGFTSVPAIAQSQEPKPGRDTAAPTADATPVSEAEGSGLGANQWQSPTWGISVTWNPDVWTVENELIDRSYEGLQLGSSASTVYIEAYEGFDGSAQQCLAAAEQEIAERANTREVTRLSGRALPEPESDDIASELFGVVADLPDGTVYRGAEYVSCRTLKAGAAVLELTWQTAIATYIDDLPRARDLFASLTPSDSEGP
jgi:hypothetical protein